MFIEIALEDLEPTTLMAGRCLVAVLFLVPLVAAQRKLGLLRRAGWRAYALGIVNSAVRSIRTASAISRRRAST